MPRPPRLGAAKLVAALERLGFVRVRHRGRHLVLARSTSGTRNVCVVPMHDEAAVGTLGSILKQAGITIEELLKVL